MTDEGILLIIATIALFAACGVYYFAVRDLKKSIKEYEKIVKEYKEFVNKFYE